MNLANADLQITFVSKSVKRQPGQGQAYTDL